MDCWLSYLEPDNQLEILACLKVVCPWLKWAILSKLVQTKIGTVTLSIDWCSNWPISDLIGFCGELLHFLVCSKCYSWGQQHQQMSIYILLNCDSNGEWRLDHLWYLMEELYTFIRGMLKLQHEIQTLYREDFPSPITFSYLSHKKKAYKKKLGTVIYMPYCK